MYKTFKLSFLFSSLLFITSCGGIYYNVKVDSYLDTNKSIDKTKKYFVYANKQSSNPLFDKEVSSKLNKYLTYNGYSVVNSLDESNYVLIFSQAIGSGKTSTYTTSSTTNRQSYQLNIHTGEFDLVNEPQINIQSHKKTTYTRVFTMHLYESDSFYTHTRPLPLWVGETISSGSSSDLRKVIDYLIVATFEHLGIDTGGQKTHRILRTDDRVDHLY